MVIQPFSTEIWSQIVHFVVFEDGGEIRNLDPYGDPNLSNLRLSCKFLSHLASRQLFAAVSFDPTEKSLENCAHILDTAHLRLLVRELRIVTLPPDETVEHG